MLFDGDLPDIQVDIRDGAHTLVMSLWAHSTADALATFLRRVGGHERRVVALDAIHVAAAHLFRRHNDDRGLREVLHVGYADERVYWACPTNSA